MIKRKTSVAQSSLPAQYANQCNQQGGAAVFAITDHYLFSLPKQNVHAQKDPGRHTTSMSILYKTDSVCSFRWRGYGGMVIDCLWLRAFIQAVSAGRTIQQYAAGQTQINVTSWFKFASDK
jgi:hypothetical protein